MPPRRSSDASPLRKSRSSGHEVTPSGTWVAGTPGPAAAGVTCPGTCQKLELESAEPSGQTELLAHCRVAPSSASRRGPLTPSTLSPHHEPPLPRHHPQKARCGITSLAPCRWKTGLEERHQHIPGLASRSFHGLVSWGRSNRVPQTGAYPADLCSHPGGHKPKVKVSPAWFLWRP